MADNPSRLHGIVVSVVVSIVLAVFIAYRRATLQLLLLLRLQCRAHYSCNRQATRRRVSSPGPQYTYIIGSSLPRAPATSAILLQLGRRRRRRRRRRRTWFQPWLFLAAVAAAEWPGSIVGDAAGR